MFFAYVKSVPPPEPAWRDTGKICTLVYMVKHATAAELKLKLAEAHRR
jgi:hypothetical protein